MSAEVCLAAMIPARRAACNGSPFFTAPARTSFKAARDIVIDPRATASRSVTGLPPTSTILMRPRASMWLRRKGLPALCFIAVAPRQIERQAFQRHGEVDALQLHIIGNLERARREVQDGFDP